MANSMVSTFQRDIERFHDRPDVMQCKYCPLVLVPMITSKPKNHPWHDDRTARTAGLVAAHRPGEVAVCDILDIDEALPKSKLGGSRNPHEIERHILVAAPAFPQAEVVFLLDDVITTGGRYAACRDAIRPCFPHAHIVGVFLARQKFGYEYTVVGFPEA